MCLSLSLSIYIYIYVFDDNGGPDGGPDGGHPGPRARRRQGGLFINDSYYY